jgi:hypothetical protein
MGIVAAASVSATRADVPVPIGRQAASPSAWPASVDASMSGSRSSAKGVGPRMLLIVTHCVGNREAASFRVGANQYSSRCTHYLEYRRTATADWAMCLVNAPVPNVPYERRLRDASNRAVRATASRRQRLPDRLERPTRPLPLRPSRGRRRQRGHLPHRHGLRDPASVRLERRHRHHWRRNTVLRRLRGAAYVLRLAVDVAERGGTMEPILLMRCRQRSATPRPSRFVVAVVFPAHVTANFPARGTAGFDSARSGSQSRHRAGRKRNSPLRRRKLVREPLPGRSAPLANS